MKPIAARYHSYFVTTYRAIVLYFFANLVIVPVYGICIHILSWAINDRTLAQNPNLVLPLRAALWIAAAVPIVLIFYTPSYWHMGFRDRGPLVLASLLTLFLVSRTSSADLQPSNDDIIHLAQLFAAIWILLGTATLLLRIKLRLIVLTLIALALSGLIVIGLWQRPISFSVLTYWSDIGYKLLEGAALVTITLFAVFRVGFWVRTYSEKLKHRYWILRIVLCLLAILWMVILLMFFPQELPLRAACGLGLMFAAADPRNFSSRQLSHLRGFFRPTRHDRLYELTSPLVGGNNPWNSFVERHLRKWLSFDNTALFVWLAVIVGGLVIPAVTYLTSEDESRPGPVSLLIVGVTSTLVLMIIYSLLWLLRNSSRYIVTQFEVARTATSSSGNGDTPAGSINPELQAIANLITHTLVEELQRISTLLELRQVENIHLNADDSNAFFVTSGVDQEFIDEMHQLLTVDVASSGAISPGRLFLLALRLLARIRVQGRVQRRSNGSIEIWVELHFRNNQSAAVDQVVLTENAITEIDDQFVRPIARQLALKLMVQLGQLSHLGSNWHSLDYFLRGLEASARHEWWLAIASYRQALELEESHSGTFGVGHYHLGAALIFQGNTDEGLEHLRTAEADGPSMAETQYMLALALALKYWPKLHRKEKEFDEICRRCQLALRLRHPFPEAHHLMGNVHYQRARLQEREATRGYAQQNEKLARFYFTSFERSISSFRKALSGYQRVARRTPVRRNLYPGLQRERVRLARLQILVTHQLGDSMRSLSRFSEAESYYRDVLAVNPRDMQTLTDLAKTYSVAGNWQQGEEYLLRDVALDSVASWDADFALHMGWILAGGVCDRWSTQDLGRFVNPWLQKTALGINPKFESEVDTSGLAAFTDALQFLDYAVHQRGRYITYARQTSWYDSFECAVRALSKAAPDAPLTLVEPLYVQVDEPSSDDPVLTRLRRRLRSQRPFTKQVWNLADPRLASLWLAVRASSYQATFSTLYRWNNDLKGFSHALKNPVNAKYQCFNEVVNELCYDRFKPSVNSLAESWELLKAAIGTLSKDELKTTRQSAVAEHILAGDDKRRFLAEIKNPEIDISSLFLEALGIRFGFRTLLEALNAEHFDTLILRKLEELHEPDKPDVSLLTQLICDAMNTPSLRRYLCLLHPAEATLQKYIDSDTRITVAIIEQTFSSDLRAKLRTSLSDKSLRHDVLRFLSERSLRSQVADFIEETQLSHRLSGLSNTYRRLQLGKKLYQQWEELKKGYQALRRDFNASSRPSFLERWAVDVYAETATLACRMLAEAGADEYVHAIADQTCIDLSDWYNRWKAAYLNPDATEGSVRRDDFMKFSPYVFSFQRATLHAWNAFALFREKTDPLVLARNRVRRTDRNRFQNLPLETAFNDKDFDDVQSSIKAALDLVDTHPLAVYMQARLYRQRRFFPQALEQFERLLDLISPYSPNRSIGGSEIEAPTTDYDSEPDPDRTQAFRMEYVSGRRQFCHFIERAPIHSEIAETFQEMRQVNPAIEHLMEAQRWSPHDDIDIDNFLKLANQLNNIERYDEALSVIAATYTPRSRLREIEVSTTKRNAPNVLECVINSRASRFEIARDKSRRVARNFEINLDMRTYGKNVAEGESLGEEGTEHFRNLFTQAQKVLKRFSPKSTVSEKCFPRVFEDLPEANRPANRLDLLLWIERWNKQKLKEKDKLGDDDRFPRFFLKLYKGETEPAANEINIAARYACAVLSANDLTDLLRAMARKITSKPSPDVNDDFDWIMLSHIAFFAGNQARIALGQIADLANALAYTRAQTEKKLEHAYSDASCAWVIMSFLMACADEGTPNHTEIRKRLAQYCDTYGWVYYRDVLPKDSHDLSPTQNIKDYLSRLGMAEQYLRQAIELDPERAIVHYHLARVYLTYMELIWQSGPEKIAGATIGDHAFLLDKFIVKAFRHWQHAKEFDTHGRLHRQLSWLFNQINAYKQKWEVRQYRGIAGDPTVTIPSIADDDQE